MEYMRFEELHSKKIFGGLHLAGEILVLGSESFLMKDLNLDVRDQSRMQ